MPIFVTEIGDAMGEGHHLIMEHSGDGIVILHSENPDTGESQRIVMLEEQWKLVFRTLLETYGASKCLLRDQRGNCTLPSPSPTYA